MDPCERLEPMLQGAYARFALLGCALPCEGIIAGPEKLPYLPNWLRQDEISIGEDNSHYPLNYGFLLDNGIPALKKQAQDSVQTAQTEEQRARLRTIAQYLAAFQGYLMAHAVLAEHRAVAQPEHAVRFSRIARNCRAIAQREPSSFEEAVQLFYLTWRVRSVNYTSCVGRMDVQLGKQYHRSIAEGMTRGEARGLLCELIRKLNTMGSGDTLMNVMLGGVDEQGRDVSSDFSILLMECCMELGLSEPHLNVRFHQNTPEKFIQKACEMMAQGSGQGTLYVDEAIIPMLVKAGYPLEAARCYANDGCTEITLEGNAAIEFWQMESMKTLELALFNGEESPNAPHTPVRKWNRHRAAEPFLSALATGFQSGNMAECSSFDEVMACFYRQWDEQLRRFCLRINERIAEQKQGDGYQTSLLTQALTPDTLKTGKEPVRGGFRCDNYQLLSGSLPTVADSLYAIKQMVFAQRGCTMEELLQALMDDFQGHELLHRQLKNVEKFGNDSNGVDELAAELAAHFCDFVEQYPFACCVRVLPGLYNIDFVMFASVLGATPDGRNAGDPIGCHYSPTPSCATKGVTAALLSASKGDLKRGVAASPVYVTIPRLLDTDLVPVIRSLTEGIVKLELPIVNLTVADAEELRDAMVNPQRHRDLVVRVWGYNAYFVDLDEALQRHIIERILQ